MKNIRSRYFALCCLLIGGASYADETGWNIGASIGSTDFKTDCSGTASCDTTDIGFKISGGYTFLPYLGTEIAYVDLGKATADLGGGLSGSITDSGVAIYAIGILPIEAFSFYGKAGFTRLDTKVSASASGISGSDTSTNNNFSWGVGAAYAINMNLSANFEWERYKAEFSDLGLSAKDNIDLVSLGMKYRF